VLEDGREFASPSVAATKAASLPACDGWYAWKVEQRGGETLNELRKELALRRATTNGASASPENAW
jgi:hypothetical protein